MFQRAEHTLKVSMALFAKNRATLVDCLKKTASLPHAAIVVLQGGNAEMRYCTDHELLFRQVCALKPTATANSSNQCTLYRNRIFTGVSA